MLVWIAISCLLILLGYCITLLVLYRWDAQKMTEQLKEITEDYGTNELIRSNFRNKELNEFVTNVNQLITVFKREQQNERKRTLKLKQEITNISHDLRTPLTSIKGFSDLLRDDSLTLEQREAYLDIVQSKVDTLIMTVDQFYEMSLIDSADNRLFLQQLSLESVLVETMFSFYKEFEDKALAVSIDESLLATPIYADKKALQRILINIVQNALRYAKSYFEITVRIEEGFLVLQARNDTDTIDAGSIEKVFERSYTIDPSRKDGQTGLGLYIVKKLAEKQGGKAAAYLEEGAFVLEVSFALSSVLEFD
ncbi:HAMP domain-containing histidine kinase [Enterococcus sp. 669A]|uniref:histidine kinase n=1 Tax=Candidatus Enterococcus moelleringii TaxID=2815325 RepID=A0ABS3LB85_9ENTE|nr:HAMP domain-containing histidine kinase [Enterococcus sp. 669A]